MLPVLGVLHTLFEGFHAYSAVVIIYLTVKDGIPWEIKSIELVSSDHISENKSLIDSSYSLFV